ncbi:MAG: integrase family protein [Polaromonas sp.]|nr:integrase family protein [Polaromonas sp.]
MSVGLIERLTCPSGATKAFLRDRDVSGLRVRVTAKGAKSFVYEAKLNGKAISKTLGGFPLMSISDAKDKARELAKVVKTDKQDPRELERQQDADKAAQAEADKVQTLTVGDLWPQYLEEGKPKRRPVWKPRYRADILLMSSPGGVKKVRGQGVTRVGPLYPLMVMPLSQINEDTIKAWHDSEAKKGPDYAARALMMFRGFLRWAASKPDYRGLVNRAAGSAPAILDSLPSTKANKRKDCLEVAQLPGWFAGADMLGNRTIATYLKALVLTGARREEMAGLRWEDVDFRWSRLTLADKVNDTRIIPLSPYLAQMLVTLPRVTNDEGNANPFVFAAKSASGHIEEPRSNFSKVNKHAGVVKLTIHGLRRSFSLLGEAAGAPAGAIAQVMGHSPDSIAEGYRPRSIDALRPYLAQIEKHILEQAGIVFDTKAAPGALRVIQTA